MKNPLDGLPGLSITPGTSFNWAFMCILQRMSGPYCFVWQKHRTSTKFWKGQLFSWSLFIHSGFLHDSFWFRIL